MKAHISEVQRLKVRHDLSTSQDSKRFLVAVEKDNIRLNFSCGAEVSEQWLM